MIQLKETITISSPPDEVFAFLADLNNFPKWRANLASSEIVSERATDLGARCNEEIQMGPMKIPATCEITEFAAGRTFSFQAVSPGLIYNGRVLVEPWEAGSSFTLSGSVQIEGFLKLLQPILKRRLASGVRKEVNAVKMNLETHPSPIK